MQDDIASTRGQIAVERLPAYTPELNPVEYMWGQVKTHEIANLIATKAWELSSEATGACAAAVRSSPLATRRLNFGPDDTLLYRTQ